MGDQGCRVGRPCGGLAEKRRAILDAAREVFGRDGYSRASIDAIATDAKVSTRTIYNHFAGKEQLFHTVLQESTRQVRDAQMEVIERHLGHVEDLQTDLTAFAVAWSRPMARFDSHFALVRHMHADAAHLPAEVLEDWRRSGPDRVRAALGDRFAALAAQGLLSVDEPQVAARHFVLLTSNDIAGRTVWGATSLPPEEIERTVATGVRAFLRGYLPRP